MQCSGKQSRPEAPLRAPNRFLFLADDLGKIISLSFLSSICHGDSDNFPFRGFHSFHTYTPYSENNNTFCPGPIAPSVFWSSLPCLCPRNPGLCRLYHLVLLLFCSELGSASGRHWQGIGGKEGKGWVILLHTHCSLPDPLLFWSPLRPQHLCPSSTFFFFFFN